MVSWLLVFFILVLWWRTDNFSKHSTSVGWDLEIFISSIDGRLGGTSSYAGRFPGRCGPRWSLATTSGRTLPWCLHVWLRN